MPLTFVTAGSGAAITPATSQTAGVTISGLGHILFMYMENISGLIGSVTGISGIGGTWTRIATGVDGDIWYNIGYNVTGLQTLTITLSSSTGFRWQSAEYSGQYAGAVIDNVNWISGGGTSMSLAVIAAFTNDTLILFTGTNTGGATFTSTSGMTSRQQPNGQALLDLNETAAGTYTMSGNWSANPFGMNNTLIAVKSSTSVLAAGGGGYGGGLGFTSDYGYRM